MKGDSAMANITPEQIVKLDKLNNINNMCSNEWMLDGQYFLYHKQKTLIKRIRLDTTQYLEYRLSYNSNNQTCLHISLFHHKPEDTFAYTSGMGKHKILDETPAKRKDVNKLILLTKELTTEKLLEINKNTPLATSYGIIEESEEF